MKASKAARTASRVDPNAASGLAGTRIGSIRDAFSGMRLVARRQNGRGRRTEHEAGDLSLAVENGALNDGLLLEGQEELRRLPALHLPLAALLDTLEGAEL